jgi:hypothetical protein
VLVADFKSEVPDIKSVQDRYRDQVMGYMDAAREVFGRPSKGFLVYVADSMVERVG